VAAATAAQTATAMEAETVMATITTIKYQSTKRGSKRTVGDGDGDGKQLQSRDVFEKYKHNLVGVQEKLTGIPQVAHICASL
jgi:hypothetical protein